MNYYLNFQEFEISTSVGTFTFVRTTNWAPFQCEIYIDEVKRYYFRLRQGLLSIHRYIIDGNDANEFEEMPIYEIDYSDVTLNDSNSFVCHEKMIVGVVEALVNDYTEWIADI